MTKIEKEIFDATINSVKKERDQLAEDKRELMEALRGIENTPPEGIWDDKFHQTPAWWRKLVRDMYWQANETLDKIKAREVE